MITALDDSLGRLDMAADDTADRRAQDVAALLHFSAYIAREATRLGLPVTAERARMIEQDLLRSFVCETE